MKIRNFIIFVVISILMILLAIFINKNNSNTSFNNTDFSINKTNSEINVNNTFQSSIIKQEPVEEELASFSTSLNGKDTPRSRNIQITTSILNETIVNDGETFSFCNTIGKPTADKGYEEADSFDEKGNTVKTLGGGNCQVSSTLYNVVLQISDLEVIERHAHIKPVHYVDENKDAAISYGSVDFKFKNNIGNTIKIYSNSDLNSVNIRIVKIK